MVKNELHCEICWLIGAIMALIINLILYLNGGIKWISAIGMIAAVLGIVGCSKSILNKKAQSMKKVNSE